MKNPLKYDVKIKHSESKNAWNIIGTMPGDKYKIARIPYTQLDGENSDEYNTREKYKALETAKYIVKAFNDTDEI